MIHQIIKPFTSIAHHISRKFKGKIASEPQSIYEIPRAIPQDFKPKISIIVPNYNHAPFLKARLDSIYSQTYSNFEVLLLDDCSTDESDKILKDYLHRFPQNTTYHVNEKNSGSVFHQWKKGIELATGDFIWIAESDDYSSDHFLEELVKYFINEAVMLAFCRTDFVTGSPPQKIWTTEHYLSSFKIDWKNTWIKSAHKLVNDAWAIKNIVPNVSSALFRNPKKIDSQLEHLWSTLKLYGDWIFYLKLIQGGLVAYSPHVTNFYRQHPNNTATKIQQLDIYYREQEITSQIMCQLYKVSHETLQHQAMEVYKHWKEHRGNSTRDEFSKLYNLDRITPECSTRKSNILMAAYAITSGGGETFPIFLANKLKLKGHAVTFLNWCGDKTESGVRNMLSPLIPVLERDKITLNADLIEDLGIELVHSHHASVDLGFPVDHPHVRRVITMHGMYEMVQPRHLPEVLAHLEKHIDQIVYTAQKNITPITLPSLKDKSIRIDNALPVHEINPVPRTELGIPEEDFLICLVSRAIPEKGWAEAIAAVALARKRSHRKIQLLIVGNGREYNRLRTRYASEFIHFLGFKSNVRDYFATSDLGLIPSRFKGESFPLVLIDCLFSGKPVLASNIGEIQEMLLTEEGFAGELFDLTNWKIPVKALAESITKLANNHDYYHSLLKRVPLAAEKFSLEKMVQKYENIYRKVCLQLR